MTNIELHGFDEETRKLVVEAIWAVAFRLEFGDFQDELVVTEIPSVVKDKHNRHQPFVRVFWGKRKELEICKKVLAQVPNLRKCFFDAEFVRVVHFCSFPPKTTK